MQTTLRLVNLASVLALASLSLGCGTKQELETAQNTLAACQEETARQTREVERWQERFDRAAKRWDTMESAVVESVPNALAEFDTERERILTLVPEQVQFEVSTYLDEYFDTVMQGFTLMRQDSEDIQLQLTATQKALEAIGADTTSIGRAIDEAVAEERDKRQSVAAGLAELNDLVLGFDRDRLNCKGCPERIKLSRKEREAVLAFHADLLEAISSLQRATSE